MKKLSLEELLEFINHFYVDDKLFVVVPHLYEKREFEITWTKDFNEPRWLIRERGYKELNYIASSDFIDHINREKLDLIELHVKLMDKVLVNIANLNMIVQRAKETFGEDLVDSACKEIEKFYDNLVKVIDKTTKSKKKPKLKVVKESKDE